MSDVEHLFMYLLAICMAMTFLDERTLQVTEGCWLPHGARGPRHAGRGRAQGRPSSQPAGWSRGLLRGAGMQVVGWGVPGAGLTRTDLDLAQPLVHSGTLPKLFSLGGHHGPQPWHSMDLPVLRILYGMGGVRHLRSPAWCHVPGETCWLLSASPRPPLPHVSIKHASPAPRPELLLKFSSPGWGLRLLLSTPDPCLSPQSPWSQRNPPLLTGYLDVSFKVTFNVKI